MLFRFSTTSAYRCLLIVVCAVVVSNLAAGQEDSVEKDLADKQSTDSGLASNGLWETHVRPLLNENCTKCHRPGKTSGKLDLTNAGTTIAGGKKGKAIDAGRPDESLLFQLVQKDSKPHMPPGKQLNEEQLAILKSWIVSLDPDRVSPQRNSGSPSANEKDNKEAGWLPPEQADPTTVINLLVQSQWARSGATVANRCSDRQFVRRVYLDLIGRIPSTSELNQFVDDAESDKRERLVEKLLRRVEHHDYLAKVLDALLMGRGNSQKYKQRNSSGWNRYLRMAVRENRPWNQVVKEILLARPENSEQAGATWFLFERNNKYQEIAESVGPAFFGIRIECAQCHDHPLAGEIEQRHYWGMVAFFRRGKNQQTKSGPRIVESAIGGFEEFTDLSGQSYPNELVFIDRQVIPEVRPAAGKKEKDSDSLYRESKTEGPRVPKFSRREALVDQVVEDHPRIASAMVNRVWALLMGRGIVHPFDKMDSAHPPSHPRLLKWLSNDFQRNGYDVRRLIKSIVLSDAYQLQSHQPAADSDPASFSWSLDKPLIAEAWAGSIAQLLRGQSPPSTPASKKQGSNEKNPLTPGFRKYFPDVLPEENMTRLDQTMFLSNSPAIQAFIDQSHSENHLHSRLLKMPDNTKRINQLYLEAFGRHPDAKELEAGTRFLEERGDRLSKAIDLMIWAIITSAEFRMNH